MTPFVNGGWQRPDHPDAPDPTELAPTPTRLPGPDGVTFRLCKPHPHDRYNPAVTRWCVQHPDGRITPAGAQPVTDTP